MLKRLSGEGEGEAALGQWLLLKEQEWAGWAHPHFCPSHCWRAKAMVGGRKEGCGGASGTRARSCPGKEQWKKNACLMPGAVRNSQAQLKCMQGSCFWHTQPGRDVHSHFWCLLATEPSMGVFFTAVYREQRIQLNERKWPVSAGLFTALSASDKHLG